MKPIRLGIIGCGIAAKKLHWPALQRLTDKFEISVVCNHTEPKAKEFSKMVGNVDYELDYKNVLARQDVEAVNIILPIHLNYKVTLDALKAGKHVIVEKPLAANLWQAKRMIKFPQDFSNIMMVAENFRYRPLYQQVKKLISSNKIGEVFSAVWNVYIYVSPETSPYAQTKWRIQHKHPGGFISDGGVHNIAVFRLLFGEILHGFAQVKSINKTIGELDTFSFQFLTEMNVQCSFQVCFSVNGFHENRLLIFGKKGTIVVEDNKITVKKNDQPDDTEIVEDDGGYQAQLENFYDAIRKDKPIVSTFQEGYRDLNVIINALHAAEKGKVVKFHLK